MLKQSSPLLRGDKVGSRFGGEINEERSAMNLLYAIGGILSLALLVYLFVALLKPEWF